MASVGSTAAHDDVDQLATAAGERVELSRARRVDNVNLDNHRNTLQRI